MLEGYYRRSLRRYSDGDLEVQPPHAHVHKMQVVFIVKAAQACLEHLVCGGRQSPLFKGLRSVDQRQRWHKRDAGSGLLDIKLFELHPKHIHLDS